jgi:hypothetical protein
MQSTLFKMSGQVRMDGWRRIGLDDDFPIRKALPVGVRFWCQARWARFSIQKFMYYGRYNTFICITPLYIGRDGWIALDELECSF